VQKETSSSKHQFSSGNQPLHNNFHQEPISNEQTSPSKTATYNKSTVFPQTTHAVKSVEARSLNLVARRRETLALSSLRDGFNAWNNRVIAIVGK
jgi:hypothetical protein